MALIQISTFQSGSYTVAHFGEWDGATDGRNFYQGGSNEAEATQALKDNADWGNIPREAIKAFELEMAEKGIHEGDWCDTFGEWLEANCEVVG